MDSFSTRVLDIDIEDARTQKKTVDLKLESIMSLMKVVELREKAAQKAKQEVDDCTLEILAEIDELMLAQQHAKETNDKRAREVYAQKADLATDMKKLHSRVSGVLDEGNQCLAAIDEMYKSLEKRLSSAAKQKEAADKEKLQKQAALAYQRSQMEKLVEESKKLEQQAMENSKLQEFLIDRGRVVSMLQEEISCKCLDVNLLKQELEDYQDESEISVTEGYLGPMVQEMIPRQDCECYKCHNLLEGVKGRVVASREELRTNKIVKSPIEFLQELGDLCMDHLEKDKPELLQDLADFYMDQLYKDNKDKNGLGYRKSQMVQESKRQEQGAINSLKEFLIDPVNILLKDISSKCQDVNLQKEDYSTPIIHESIPKQDCECYKKGVVTGRDVASRERMITNKFVKSQINNSKSIQELADSYMEKLDKSKRGKIRRNGLRKRP